MSVIITLAATTNAFGAETTEISDLTGEDKEGADAANTASVKAAEETGDVLTRAVQPSAVIRPADDNEIAEILKKRIFASIDESAAKASNEAYRNLYETLGRTQQLAGGAERPATYGEMVAKTYPFHPELVRVLDKRLGNIAQFQRARGALKLLAEVVAHIYNTNDDTAIINVGDIDFDSDPESSTTLPMDLAGPSMLPSPRATSQAHSHTPQQWMPMCSPANRPTPLAWRQHRVHALA